MLAGAKAGRMRALHLELSSTRWPSDHAAGTIPEHDAAALGRTRRRLARQLLARLRGACRSAHVLRHAQDARRPAASARRRPGHKHVQTRKSCPSTSLTEIFTQYRTDVIFTLSPACTSRSCSSRGLDSRRSSPGHPSTTPSISGTYHAPPTSPGSVMALFFSIALVSC